MNTADPTPPRPSAATPAPDHPRRADEQPGMKETVISLAIAFVLAFVFRGFVVEPFIIPTGSMAPTLVGAHILARSPNSGTTWAIGPWRYLDSSHMRPSADQEEVIVPDPSTGERLLFDTPPVRAGDRIFVLKYLYTIFEPSRFDVVVFKNPSEPDVNYIKRLIGLPHEEIALVDGDIFTRDTRSLPATPPTGRPTGAAAWSDAGWQIRRKPERQQRVLWQEIFDSAHTPLHPERDGRRWFQSPWVGTSDADTSAAESRAGAWTIDDSPIYRFSNSAPATLTWNEAAFPVNDYYPYDHTSPNYSSPKFPVSDVRLRAGIEPAAPGLSCWISIVARGHCFQAEIGPNSTAIRMAPVDANAAVTGPWTTLAETSTPLTLPPGRVTNAELWHADQSLQLWIDGVRILDATYDWSPAERFRNATGRDASEVFDADAAQPAADPSIYRRPRLSWQFKGAPFALHNVALERDVQYQPTPGFDDEPALATDPRRMPTLKHDQFFVCGDNSPASMDSRLWDAPDPWIAEIDPDTGVVNRQLLIGKAFFVYWPATHSGKIPIFDAGRVRFIW